MKLSAKSREAIAGVAFVAPATLFFAIFVLGPALFALILSLFQWNLLGSPVFLGLDNFAHFFADPVAQTALLNTVVFTVASVIIHVTVGLALALAANRALPGPIRYFVRTAYFLPVLMSWSAVALIWGYLFDPNVGVIDYILRLLGLPTPNWLVTPGWALVAIIIVDSWHTVGFAFIVFLAGLQSLPRELFEAAECDGAGPIRKTWSLTIPLLSPTLLFVVVISVIGGVQIFDPMYIMTRGGPGNSTLSLVMDIFNTGFHQYDMGYAAALSVITFILIMAATLVQFRFSRRWVYYEGGA